MVKAGPQEGARPIAHDYQYIVSEEWIQERIDAEGLEPSRFWHIAFELRDLPNRETRKRARELREAWQAIPGQMELPEPTEDPEAFLGLLEAWIAKQAEEREAEARAEADRALRSHQVQSSFEAEMEEWLESFGSERVRLARERGYKVSSSYAKERARKELPEAWIDTAGRAVWRERVDPSMQALRMETKVLKWMEDRDMNLSSEIIWLVDPPSSMAEALAKPTPEEPFGAEFEQQEALLIPNYLGKYNAFLPIDVDERAPVHVEDEEGDN